MTMMRPTFPLALAAAALLLVLVVSVTLLLPATGAAARAAKGLSTLTLSDVKALVKETSDYFFAQDNGCRMTYMYPSYEQVSSTDLQHPRYRVFEYRERMPRRSTQNSDQRKRMAVYFPGHAGNYQQVRSLGSYLSAAGYRVYTLDFREEFSGASARLVGKEIEFSWDALAWLWTNDPTLDRSLPPVLIGHSMGGLVAQAIAARWMREEEHISTSSFHAKDGSLFPGRQLPASLITLATPTERLPISIGMLDIPAFLLETLTALLQHPPSQLTPRYRRSGWQTLNGLSVTGGSHDLTLGDYLFTSEAHLVSSALPRILLPADHLCILWCNQLVAALAQGLIATTDMANGTEQTRALAQRLTQPLVVFSSPPKNPAIPSSNHAHFVHIEELATPVDGLVDFAISMAALREGELNLKGRGELAVVFVERDGARTTSATPYQVFLSPCEPVQDEGAIHLRGRSEKKGKQLFELRSTFSSELMESIGSSYQAVRTLDDALYHMVSLPIAAAAREIEDLARRVNATTATASTTTSSSTSTSTNTARSGLCFRQEARELAATLYLMDSDTTEAQRGGASYPHDQLERQRLQTRFHPLPGSAFGLSLCYKIYLPPPPTTRDGHVEEGILAIQTVQNIAGHEAYLRRNMKPRGKGTQDPTNNLPFRRLCNHFPDATVKGTPGFGVRVFAVTSQDAHTIEIRLSDADHHRAEAGSLPPPIVIFPDYLVSALHTVKMSADDLVVLVILGLTINVISLWRGKGSTWATIFAASMASSVVLLALRDAIGFSASGEINFVLLLQAGIPRYLFLGTAGAVFSCGIARTLCVLLALVILAVFSLVSRALAAVRWTAQKEKPMGPRPCLAVRVVLTSALLGTVGIAVVLLAPALASALFSAYALGNGAPTPRNRLTQQFMIAIILGLLLTNLITCEVAHVAQLGIQQAIVHCARQYIDALVAHVAEV